MLGKAHNSWEGGDHEACGRFAKAAQEYAWDMLHMGNWRRVPTVWRKLYAVAARTRAAALLTAPAVDDKARCWQRSETVVQAAVYALDMALMFGGPRESGVTHELIAAIDAAYGAAKREPVGGASNSAPGGASTNAAAGAGAGAGAGGRRSTVTAVTSQRPTKVCWMNTTRRAHSPPV